MAILGVDVSHYQGAPNWAQVKASGRDFAILKATESTNYVDPTLATNRRNAHAAGLIVGFYHFARAGNAAAEAAWFLRNVGSLQAGEFLVLDWEVPGADPVGWSRAWLDAVYRATGVRPLIYMNQSAAAGSNWSSVAADYGLWLAKYDNSTAQTSVPGWSVAMKQYSDRGAVPGIGSCDVNVFFGSRDQLLAYGKGGTPPAPGPALTVQEDDMAIIEHAQRGIALLGPGYYRMLPPNEVGPALQSHGLSTTIKMPDAASFDLAISAHLGSANLADIKQMLRGDDPDHDNIWLLWAALYGQNPTGNGNVIIEALKKVQSQAVDPVALAKALLADDASVKKLGDAIAAGLATRVGNG